jgi:hypothetical protein
MNDAAHPATPSLRLFKLTTPLPRFGPITAASRTASEVVEHTQPNMRAADIVACVDARRGNR